MFAALLRPNCIVTEASHWHAFVEYLSATIADLTERFQIVPQTHTVRFRAMMACRIIVDG